VLYLSERKNLYQINFFNFALNIRKLSFFLFFSFHLLFFKDFSSDIAFTSYL